MPYSSNQINDKLELARSLVSHLEAGNDEEAASVIAGLAGFRDNLLFPEVGRLTRELHESINSFVTDTGLADIAENEMPDAAERLRYVIATTEQAANTTLEAVEESLPLVDLLHNDARSLAKQWTDPDSPELLIDESHELSIGLSNFLKTTQSNSEVLRDKLSEVLMAQSYQDLTGQVICKVINLVNDVEGKLVELVRLSGSHENPSNDKIADVPDISPQGPVVPGVDKGNLITSQDDVDDLLSSLGF